eukprot:CAMPEP_0170481966 /NCGR_PEP_ID=MMETSP0208-20121228/2197_1 /TAXON_ID=197538 /ORGANISM="Strombidium inclinatum, Strain S3" /LENGTH=125 /DNA_ID=CAMNT_0010754757 /DNA_START=41 /DNA_END=418 /DNA_ORIENTATION=-
MDLDDFNTLDFAFVGGEGRPIEKDLCPVDKLFLNYNIDLSTQSREQTRGWAKETYEIFRVNSSCEIDDAAEELARQKLKVIITFLETTRAHLEKEARRHRDFKKVLIGQKYETQEVLQQLDSLLD